MVKAKELPRALISATVRYDQDTGVLLKRDLRYTGEHWYSPKLTKSSEGYYRIYFGSQSYYVHRVIFALCFNIWDSSMRIDHIDGNKENNSISNLRLASPRENAQNRVQHRAGKLCGCHLNSGKWRASIWLGKKRKHLGYFDTEEQAHVAYVTACNLLKQGEKV